MKKVFASLLGVVVFFLLVPTCTILIARDLTSEKTIGKILDVAPELIDENTNGDSLADAVIEEVEAIDPAFADLLDEERLQEELVKIVASMLEAMGDPTREQMVDVTSLKEYLREVLNEYEDEMNVTISEAELDTLFESFDEINETREEWKREFGDIFIIFEVIYSNKLLITLISSIVLCIILMYILLRSIPDTLIKVKTPFAINGVGALLIGYGIASILKSTEMNSGPIPTDLISVVTNPFYKVGIISIATTVVLVIVAKVLKHNKSISNSNAALENLGNVNYVSNSNISNTPYNGYQNH
jgi:hypothetical protein